jgi:hypothetical protein
MEPDVPPPSDDTDRPGAGRAEWRLLHRLRDRVEAAAAEIERLRAENAALAERVAALRDSQDTSPSFSFGGGGEDPDALREKVQGFIDTIDGLLGAARPGGDGSDAAPSETASSEAEPSDEP